MEAFSAPEKLRIVVTDEDIELGINIFGYCPVARAVKRSFPGVEVFVYLNVVQIFLLDSFSLIHYRVSRRMRRFTFLFDDGKKVNPGVFIVTRVGTWATPKKPVVDLKG